MKKILFIILLCLCINVNASENVEVKIDYVSGVYYSYKENGLTMWGQFGYVYADGVISYCADIKTPITKTNYIVDNSIDISKNVKLIAYFGYGYDNNNSLKYYMATQKLIWKELGTDVVFTTQSEGKGDIIDVSYNTNKILDLIKDYDKLPLYNYNFEFLLGATYRYIDSNYVDRNNYMIIDNSNNDVSQVSSYIMQFEAKEIGSNCLRVKRRYINRFDNVSLVATSSQNIIKIGSIEDIYKDYKYVVKTGSLNINLTDIMSNSKTNTGLTTYDGIIFDMFDSNNNLIKSIESNSNGIITFNDLAYGKYEVKARNLNTYKDNLASINVDISDTTYNYNYDYVLTPKSIDLKLIKKYKFNGIEKSDSDITFEIYNSKNEKQEITTNEYGCASILLYYDNYKIIQKSDSKIKNKYEFYINTADFSNNSKEYVMSDNVISTKIKIELVDDNEDKIVNSKVLINDKEYMTDINGIVLTDYVNEGEYIIDANNDLYDLIDKKIIAIDENSEFIYDNEDAYVFLKIMLNKKETKISDSKIVEEINNNEQIIENIIMNEDSSDNNNEVNNIESYNDKNNNEEINNEEINNKEINDTNDIILNKVDNDSNIGIKTLPYLSSNSYFKGLKWVKRYLYH